MQFTWTTLSFINEAINREAASSARASEQWWMKISLIQSADDNNDDNDNEVEGFVRGKKDSKILSAFARIMCSNKTSSYQCSCCLLTENSPSLPTFFLLSLLSSQPSVGTKKSEKKQVGSLCLCWGCRWESPTTVLWIQRVKEYSSQLWKIIVGEWSHSAKLYIGLRGISQSILLHETSHTSKCFQGFLALLKSVQQIGICKITAWWNCIWCDERRVMLGWQMRCVLFLVESSGWKTPLMKCSPP